MEEEKMAENKIKTIGVLTSGGDAPGMNAAIYLNRQEYDSHKN